MDDNKQTKESAFEEGKFRGEVLSGLAAIREALASFKKYSEEAHERTRLELRTLEAMMNEKLDRLEFDKEMKKRDYLIDSNTLGVIKNRERLIKYGTLFSIIGFVAMLLANWVFDIFKTAI
jgi:hypothetical protein